MDITVTFTDAAGQPMAGTVYARTVHTQRPDLGVIITCKVVSADLDEHGTATLAGLVDGQPYEVADRMQGLAPSRWHPYRDGDRWPTPSRGLCAT